MAARRTTGLSGLDAQIGGGVPAGTVHLLLGEPMNAFELFAAHFAAGGVTSGPVVYLATERAPTEILDSVARVGGDGKKVEVVVLPVKGKWDIPDVRAGARTIIDDFSTIALEVGFEESLDRLRALREQVRKGGSEMLVAMTAGILDKASETRMRMWADGVMELGFDRQGFGLYPYLKVTKMRGIPESSRFILFKETDAGLFMESTRRVF